MGRMHSEGVMRHSNMILNSCRKADTHTLTHAPRSTLLATSTYITLSYFQTRTRGSKRMVGI